MARCPAARPRRVRDGFTAYGLADGVLLVLGALGASGAGPFGI